MARPGKKSIPCADDARGVSFAAQIFQAPENQLRLADLPIGARLLVRSRSDWRTAAISRFLEDTGTVVLTVCSPSGHAYRLRRDLSTEVFLEGGFAILPSDADDTWRDNFTGYDRRW